MKDRTEEAQNFNAVRTFASRNDVEKPEGRKKFLQDTISFSLKKEAENHLDYEDFPWDSKPTGIMTWMRKAVGAICTLIRGK